MAYIVNFTDGSKTPISVVNNGVDTSTDIGLLGRGHENYGEIMAENLLHMMEHFAGPLAPNKPVEGQLWYDSNSNQMKYLYDTLENNGDWKGIATMMVQNVEPVGFGEDDGQFWLNDDDGKLYFYYNGAWIHLNQDFVRRDEFSDLANQAASDGFEQLLALGISPLTLTSTTHPFQIGPDPDRHLAMDNQQIQGRQGLGTPADLSLNALGGNVNIGQDLFEVRISGDLVTNNVTSPEGSVLSLGDGTLTFDDIDLLDDFVRKDELKGLVGALATDGFEQLRALGTSPLTLSSTTHPFQIGEDSDRNLAMDNQQIQGRQGLGSFAALSLNALGGNVTIGNSGSIVTVGGTLRTSQITGTSEVQISVGSSSLNVGNNSLTYNGIDLLAPPSSGPGLPSPLVADHLRWDVNSNKFAYIGPFADAPTGEISRFFNDEIGWCINAVNTYSSATPVNAGGFPQGGALGVQSNTGKVIQGSINGNIPGSNMIDAAALQSGSLRVRSIVAQSPASGGWGFVSEGNSGNGGYLDLSGRGYNPFTGCHQAVISKTENPEIGDILVDLDMINTTVNDSIGFVSSSTTANDPSAIGVYTGVNEYSWATIPPAFIDREKTSTTAIFDDQGMVTGYDVNEVYTVDYRTLKENYYLIEVNSIGEGGINVCGRGGNIRKGDLIVTSDMPGKGQRQADDIIRSYTVARARQNYDFSHPDEVKLIACIYLCG